MEKITILVLICLLFAPISMNAYYSAEQFRTDIMDSIRYDNQKQQYQDILDSGNKGYKDAFDTYYQTTNNLKNEYDLKLKELQIKEDAQDRTEAWSKEKAVLDKQLELINQNKILQEENEKLKVEKGSQDLIQSSKDITEQIIKNRKPEEKSSGLPIYNPTITTTQTPPVATPILKKNIFSRIFQKVVNLFK